jgi:aminoglycoside phosphotransferase family enzyme
VDTSLEEKLVFLSQASAYGRGVVDVEVIETHLSWVFLAGDSVYKLKKPVFRPPVDFSSLAARRIHCEAEVRLNQGLAPGVYLGVVPLVRTPGGTLQLNGSDDRSAVVTEWLVHMRRLHRAAMLDAAIATGSIPESAPEAIGRRLAEFYRSARVIAVTGSEYRERLASQIHDSASVLMDPTFALRDPRVRGILSALRRFLDRETALFEERVHSHRIVEGHGDLKPEHVYLSDPLLIIDCLEFSTALRELDSLDELAYLGLECSRLGATSVGERALQAYRSFAQDNAPGRLVSFYRAARGLLRAKLCLWHLLDCPVTGFDHWRIRARQYLDLAEAAAQDCGAG